MRKQHGRASTSRGGRRILGGRRAALLLAVSAPLAGCLRRASPATSTDGIVSRVMTPQTVNATEAYRRAGYLAADGNIPFVGSARSLAGPDSGHTFVIVAFSFPNRSLAFARDGDQYRAAYDVTYDVRSGNTTVQHRSTRSEVRVGTFRETTRSEESVITQQLLMLAPGTYTLEITARDAGGTNTGKSATTFTVPGFIAEHRLAAIPVYQVALRGERGATPALVANPRSTVVFGRDSLLLVYVEAYGSDVPRTVKIEVASEGAPMYSDTVALDAVGDVHSAIVRLPVSRIGLGVLGLTLSSSPAVGPLVRLPVVVRLGDELAVASFDEMLQYLRFFTSAERLRALLDTTNASRSARWSTFLRETDTTPATPENEVLRDYLRRVQAANGQFREDAVPGWLTDRGRAYAALGDPDRIAEPSADASGRGTLVWEYRQPHLQLVFVEQAEPGHWRMTPASQADFEVAFKRLTLCGGCR